MASTRIVSIGSGKGGVGKSFVVSSLGITLSKLGQSVLLVDLDFSGPNLHTSLGEVPRANNIDLFFSGQSKLADLVHPTMFPRLAFIQGTSSPGERTIADVRRLVQACRDLPFSEILFDLGPGSQEVYLELMKLSDERMFVTTPEPPCIEKNYRLVENFLLYSIRKDDSSQHQKELKQALEQYRKVHSPGQITFREFLQQQTGWTWPKDHPVFVHPVRMIVNQTRAEADLDLGPSIRLVCHHFFDFTIDFLGALQYDNAVWQSFRACEPMLHKHPFSPLAGQFLSMSRRLLSADLPANPFRAVI